MDSNTVVGNRAKQSSLVPNPGSNAGATLQACLSPACFWMPERAEPQTTWLEHAPIAFWIVEALQPGIIVELGTLGGVSYFAFCQAVHRLELETRCYAVGTWKSDEHAGYYDDDDVFQNVRKYNEIKYSGFSTLIRSTFDEALFHFSDGTIDLLHIDGRRFCQDVRRYFERWRPKLSDRAVVLFHNTNVREGRIQEVSRQELCLSHPHFEFLHGHGLCVIGIGARLPAQITALFAAARNPKVTSHIRAAYSRLGYAVALQSTTTTLESAKMEVDPRATNQTRPRGDARNRAGRASREPERSQDGARRCGAAFAPASGLGR